MDVKHFVACVDTLRILPPNPQRWLLHDTHHYHAVPADEVAPFVIAKTSLFTRFYGARGSQRFRVRVIWTGPEGENVLLRIMNSIFQEFDPALGVEDFVFTIDDLHVPGYGTLEYELTANEEPEIILATEYLELRSHEQIS